MKRADKHTAIQTETMLNPVAILNTITAGTVDPGKFWPEKKQTKKDQKTNSRTLPTHNHTNTRQPLGTVLNCSGPNSQMSSLKRAFFRKPRLQRKEEL